MRDARAVIRFALVEAGVEAQCRIVDGVAALPDKVRDISQVELDLLKAEVRQAERFNCATLARKLLKRMAAHDQLIIAWLCEVEALRFVGYTSRRVPRRIHEVPLTRDQCHVYITGTPYADESGASR